jgi:hypothetical protein
LELRIDLVVATTTDFTLTVTAGPGTDLSSVQFSYLIVSVSQSSLAAYGGDVNLTGFDGVRYSDIFSTAANADYLLQGLVALNSSFVLNFSINFNNNFVLSFMSQNNLNFGVSFIAAGVPPALACAACHNQTYISSTSCIENCP